MSDTSTAQFTRCRDINVRLTGPFRFFNLPRELRDLVYNEVWSHTPFLYPATLQRKPSPLVCIVLKYRKYADNWTTDNRFPPWLLVKTIFLDKAMRGIRMRLPDLDIKGGAVPWSSF
jgi:hypothetical protein